MRVPVVLVIAWLTACGRSTDDPGRARMTHATTEHWAIETAGPASALVRLDAPGPRIAVEGVPRQLRWDASQFYFIRGGRIERMARATPHVISTIATSTMVGELALVGGRLVWSEPDTSMMDGGRGGRAGRLMLANPDGSAARPLVTPVDARALASDGDTIYFSDGDAIDRIGVAGTGRKRLVAATGMTPLLRLDGAWLYYTREGGVSRLRTTDGTVEVVADGLEIPIGLAVHDGEVVILANAVISKPYPQHARPARLIRIRNGAPAKIVWSEADALVGNLDVVGRRARFEKRAVGVMEPTLVDVALD